ncbi:hypothetical protein [Planktothrix sp. PCC 11201]|uniref:hypothetical protein n=1 Tax=Planktothrix sp. PCC 11201 TaxID=1729650 RepID=UPI00117E3324|nr:hypothetical protein [Planktothrix sp. PCC 11201]
MTGYFEKVYEEVYKGYLIEIYKHSSFAPEGVGSTHFTVRVNGEYLAGSFDGYSYNHFQQLEKINPPPNPEESFALMEAKKYCDAAVEALEQRENERSSLNLADLFSHVFRKISHLIRIKFL